MYLYLSKENEAEAEFNQMMVHLIERKVKYNVISNLSKTWNKMKNPSEYIDMYGI